MYGTGNLNRTIVNGWKWCVLYISTEHNQTTIYILNISYLFKPVDVDCVVSTHLYARSECERARTHNKQIKCSSKTPTNALRKCLCVLHFSLMCLIKGEQKSVLSFLRECMFNMICFSFSHSLTISLPDTTRQSNTLRALFDFSFGVLLLWWWYRLLSL